MTKRKRIAVLIASIDREYQQDFAKGLATAGMIYDVDICIFNSQGHPNVAITTNDAGESIIYDLPDLNQFDGVISLLATMGNEISSEKVKSVLRSISDKPHVSIDVPWEDAVTITFDDQVSVREITEHMITEHGIRRVAFVCGPLTSNVAVSRLEACRETLEKYHLKLEDNMIFDGEWTRVGGQRAAEELLNRGGQLPDAVICANDDMALSVYETFAKNDIQVPDEVLITGFDALREAVMRGLTTICRPIDQSARKAVEILSKWIDGNEPEERNIILNTIPIYGETCGCDQGKEQSIEKLRGLGNAKWQMETIMTRVSMFSSLLASVSDEKEAQERIHELITGWDIQQLYLCVDPSICREVKADEKKHALPDQMLLLYGIRNGIQNEPVLFQTKGLAPVLTEMRKSPVCLVFCPLYYRDVDFGYVAMEMGDATGAALYPILMLLNGALMSLYLQTNVRKYAQTIEQLASHDIMTGMLNRRGYTELAPAVLNRARAEGKIFAMLSADMDHMKDINDEYGHLMGDEAIVRMGRGMTGLEKLNMVPVHISGDEFLAYGIVDSMEEARGIISAVNRELAALNEQDPWIRDISASLGIYAAVPREGEVIDDFLTRADRAMYADKNRKKKERLNEEEKGRG